MTRVVGFLELALSCLFFHVRMFALELSWIQPSADSPKKVTSGPNMSFLFKLGSFCVL
jgi:hypothetical protein